MRPVHLNLVRVLVNDALGHHCLVGLRDNGNEEVQQDDQHEELVEQPECPNYTHHETGFSGVLRQMSGSRGPEGVHWSIDVANGVPIGVEEICKEDIELFIVGVFAFFVRDLHA